MRTTLIVATSVALLSATFANTQLQAQQAAAPRGGSPAVNHGIAVIDIKYILDNYSKMKQASNAFKADFDATGAGFKKEQEAMMKDAERLKDLKVGSPDYKKLEEKLAKQQSDMKVNASIKQREFEEREAKTFLTAYREITSAVKIYAERNGISLVVQFNGAPVDQNNPQAVRAELGKMVLYNHRDIDITDQILAELNRGATAAAPPRGTPAQAQQAPPKVR